MKESLDPRDYTNKQDFFKVLDDEFQSLTLELAQAMRYSLCTQEISRQLTEMKLLAMEQGYELQQGVKGPQTYKITVVEYDGAGGYFFLNGFYRKPGNKVLFTIVPPTGARVKSVKIGEETILGVSMFEFYMPSQDVTVEIRYESLDLFDVNYTVEWSDLSCTVQLYTYQLGWSDRVCVGQGAFFTVQWNDQVCLVTGSEYFTQWSDIVCVVSASAFQTQWSDPACVVTPTNDYNIRFTDPECVVEESNYRVDWTSRVCEAQSADYSVRWEDPECAVTDTQTGNIN